MKQLTAIHVVPDLRRRAGGIAATVPTLATALRAHNIDSRFITFAHDEDFSWSEHTTCVPRTSSWNLKELKKPIDNLIASLPLGTPVVLHSHGLWDLLNHASFQAAYRAQVPTVLSLHGMLLHWARRHKGVRKDVAWWLYQKRDLKRANAVHVTSLTESQTLPRIVPASRVHTIPFGVSLTSSVPRPFSNETTRTLLFLGRLHPVKNLEGLIKAFVRAAPPHYCLKLIGPDECNHKSTLLALIDALKASSRVIICEPVFGAAKETAIAQADGIILPSFTENFGAVVAEALALGRPVISSTGTPWEVLRSERCGWWVSPDVDSLAKAVSEICAKSNQELRIMGERGRDYVSRALCEDKVAEHMAKLYSSILSK